MAEFVAVWSEPLSRFTLFAALFVLLALLELLFAARAGGGDSDGRHVANFGLGVGNALLAAAIPIGGLAAATLCEARNIGLFQGLAAPFWAMLAGLLLARSLASYLLHRAMHRSAWLWRIHRVHHSDRMVDLSTGLRNHPAEMVLAMLIAAAVTLSLGAPVTVAVAADLILFGPALWTHANVALPARGERITRGVFVTPAMHVVHHSAARDECDSNFGDLFSFWDRAFGTYRARDAGTRLGLGPAEDEAADSLWRQLVRPLKR